jgi:hypothetical protein
MATSSKIDILHGEEPQFFVSNPASVAAANVTSELLQQNQKDHHVFYNDDGFHNHIAHHLLTIYALGADPTTLKNMYRRNAAYQRPAMKPRAAVVRDMSDPKVFEQALHKEDRYSDFLDFFKTEIEASSWPVVVNKYLFAGDARSDDLLVRTFSGFLHPLIHLGFGVEFNQPSIVAEALSQSCVHDNWIAPLFLESEKAATKLRDRGTPPKSAMDLLKDIQRDEKLKASTHWPDPNKIRDGILARAPDRMVHHASQYYIQDASELDKRTAEMMHLVAYFTMAAQRPPKSVKVDFFYMHCVNSGIFFSKLMQADWLSPSNKMRLLEWKIRGDLALYVSRNTPSLSMSAITSYSPKEQDTTGTNPWPRIIERVRNYPDDGHASKLVRALAHSKEVCTKFENDPDLGFQIKGNDWDRIGHMAIDSAEMETGPTWVRGAGFQEAWKDVPERKVKL